MVERFGLQPIAADLFGTQSYYLHMILQVGEEQQLLAPSGDLTEADIRTSIESGLKRGSSGFLKVVGLWTPPETPTADPFGQQAPSFKQYRAIADQLRQDYTVTPMDLTTGQVPPEVDVLVLVAPQGMSERELYAVDQYLMRGGAVVVATGAFVLNPDPLTGNLGVAPVEGGIEALLGHYGLDVQPALVLDPQNEPFPVQMARDVGGMQVMEIQAMNYPFFVDVRPDGMDRESPILASVPALTLNWASPLLVDEAATEGQTVTTLMRSSPQSWLRTGTDIQPDPVLYPELGFPVEGEPQSYPLAVSLQGAFASFFEGKPIPTAASALTGETTPDSTTVPTDTIGTIVSSPDTARLVVIGSGEFLNDIVFQLSSSLTGERYLNSLQVMQNAVDWSVEDLDLLTIRSRGTSARVLEPLTEQQQRTWEIGNYAVALLALAGIGALWRLRRRNEKPMVLLPPTEGGAGRVSGAPPLHPSS